MARMADAVKILAFMIHSIKRGSNYHKSTPKKQKKSVFARKKAFPVGNSTTKKDCFESSPFLHRRSPVIPVKRGQAPGMTVYDTSIIENTMTNSATVSPTPSTMR